MKRNIQRLICLLCLFCLLPAWALGAETSGVQIRHPGGSASRDGVTLSKTIQGTQAENLFDITLAIETTQSREQLWQAEDAAVVLVMDISATMNQKLEGESGLSRLDAAKEAANTFVRAFCDPLRPLGTERELGFVTFNRDAQTLFPLEKVDASSAEAWTNAIEGMTAPGSQSGLRWTNIEGGLLLAGNLLSASDAPHKFIILLSDGFPTTYLTQDANPQSMESLPGRDPTSGFWDQVKKVECTMGTSYSETAAQHARAAASAIRQSGADIFSIGVGIGSPIKVGDAWAPETIQAHIDRITWNASVVERPAKAGNAGYVYEIGAANDPDSYRYWLGGRTANGGIGGGPEFDGDSAIYGPYGAYADANDAEALAAAFENLLKEIETINQSAIRDTWIASDPMGEMVDFLYFLNAGENAVSFADQTLSWDLLASPCTSRTEGGITYSTYTLSYRVRLKNESAAFQPATPESREEEPAYLTNGNAELHYKVEENGKLSEERVLSFAKPTVEGYLGRLQFRKTTAETGGAHGGVSFALTHRSDCPVCGGAVVIAPITGVSEADGQTVLSSIPSGHSYTLREAENPAYLQREYRVEVHYGQTTLLNSQGRPIDAIVNELRPGSIALAARKIMDGEAPPNGQFSFLLLNEQGDVVDSQPNGDGGRIAFEPLTFSVPGRYVYQIREVMGDDASILFDETVYHIVIEAQKTESGCEPRIASIQRNGTVYTGEPLFKNRTRPDPTPVPSPTPAPPQTNVPKTGDESQPLLWGGLLLLSAGIGAAMIIRSRKKT